MEQTMAAVDSKTICLALLGLEGIESSSFTYDSLVAAFSDRGGF